MTEIVNTGDMTEIGMFTPMKTDVRILSGTEATTSEIISGEAGAEVQREATQEIGKEVRTTF